MRCRRDVPHRPAGRRPPGLDDYSFDLFERNWPAIKEVGAQALAGTRRNGVSVFYMDRSLGDGIVREWPDGTRERVERRDGQHVVVQTYAPRG